MEGLKQKLIVFYNVGILLTVYCRRTTSIVYE